MLCREIELTTCSIILNAAGKFILLAPNTPNIKKKIKAVEEKINEWLIRAFYGECTIGISFVEASCNDFTLKNFSDMWDTQAKELERKKYKKIDLEKYGGPINDYLSQFNNDLNNKLCPFCGKRPSSKDVENDSLLGESSACTICRDHIYLGTNLVKSPRIAVTTADAEIYGDKLREPIFGFYQLSLDATGSLSKLAEKGTLLKYWDISISKKGKVAKDVTAKFINGYIPVYSEEDETEDMLNRLLHGDKSEKAKDDLFDMLKEGAPKTFHHIAKMALNKGGGKEDKFCGVEALGVLKADVDNLGLIFACGLKRNSISQLSTLSRQLNCYFSIYLPHFLATENEFKDIYTIFSGGDDLFLIGPWNKVVALSLIINDSFQKYVCGNNQITISAGISVVKPGEPVPYISEITEHALEKAKGNSRNSVTFFDEPVKWEEFKELNTIKKRIKIWLEKSIISNAALHRLNSLLHMAGQEKHLLQAIKTNEGINMAECECLRWKAFFKYTLARNVGRALKGDEKNQAIDEVEEAAVWLDHYGRAMKIPLWQIIYNQR